MSALKKPRDAHVHIRSVGMQFGDHSVLQDVQLSIAQGEFVAVVGRSGCGKSTLLRLIAGLERPTQGEVEVSGRLHEGLHAGTRVLFQEARLLPWKRVLDNVRIGANGKSKDDALEALRQVGLAERGGEWPYVLSGGQKQRVALARALAGKPELLLLDEPLGALDALTRIEMQQLLEKLWMEQGFTVMLVTHDVSEAVALADRVLLIDQGKVAMDIRIALARPRLRDSGFIHFEKLILDRIMVKNEEQGPVSKEQRLAYSI